MLGLMLVFSCGEQSESETTSDSNEDVVQDTTSIIDEVVQDLPEGVLQVNGTVLSVQDQLIMPSDYLTVAMTVATDSGDTLVFLNMDEYSDFEGKSVKIQYKLTESERLLVCFDCDSYSGKIDLNDITSVATDVTFESMKLNKYTEDAYIIPASIFEMMDADGNITNYRSDDNSLISDSTKMSSAYYNYGVVITAYPELVKLED